VRLEGALLGDGAVRIELSNGTVAAHEAASGPFDFSFTAPAGPVGLTFSLDQPVAAEARPLGAVIKSVKLDGRELDLSSPTLMSVAHLPAEEAFAMMAQAASRTRDRAGVELTAIRGPHSSELEAFLDREVGNYDLVITHNSVFRPAVAAIEAARKRGVKSILIPHLHLDDDFYHFKDVVGSSQQATVVLAAPKAACRFLAGNGEGNVGYLPAGIDMGEAYTADDVAAFRQVHKRRGPFVLVLGRKAGAKNYQLIIDAVAEVAEDYDLHAVLIGPDDDGVIIDTTHAAYLGRQPRSIVRGALQSCVAVVNMSTSESFGIVLLEAWLAGRPVIANADCAAFHDLAVDGHNALLVSPDGLAAAVARLATDEALAQALVARGRVTARAYDWRNLRAEFAEFCSGLIEEGDRSLPISFGVDGIGA
jgi:glycosyltransferase involved in cell wall biosynthesis